MSARPHREAAPPAGAAGRVRRWGPMLALVALTLAAHGNTLGNGFVWDDETIVVKNPDTREISRIGRVLLSPDETPPYYRPLNRASYLLDFQLFGMEPRGFHLVNLLLQVACVLALWALGKRLFGRSVPAFLAAALLAVHPVATEVVAFVTARNNLFALLFSLLALSAFIDAAGRDSWARAWLSAGWLFLGLASKEPAAMVLPVMATWLASQEGPWRARFQRARMFLPHAVALCVYLVLRYVSLGGLAGGPPGARPPAAPLIERLGANLVAVPTYLWLLVFPRDLTIYHVVPATSATRILALTVAWAALAAAAAWIARRGSLASRVGLAWFAFGLLPVANLLPLPTATVIAERYVYIPAVGLWIVAADVAARFWDRTTRKAAVAAGFATVLLLLSARTIVRNRDWRDDLSLARAAVAVEPMAPMAHYNLGLALHEAGDDAGALRHWEESARIDRADGRALVALGKLATDRGELDAAEAHFRRALPMLVGPTEARLNLGKLLDLRGDAEGARLEWEAVLRARPDHADALTQLGVLHASQGNLVAAEERFRAALRSDPGTPEALFNMGRISELAGRPAEAASYYRRFIAVRPPGSEEALRIAEQRLRALGAGMPGPR